MKDSRTARIPMRRMPAERPMRIPEVKSWDGELPAVLETIPRANAKQDQQYTEIPLSAAPELLPYPCDGLLKRTIFLHIANNLSCAYIKSNSFTSFLPHP